MPIPEGRGKALRIRNKSIPGHPDEYLQVHVMEKLGPRGGQTVAYKKKKKGGV